MMSFVRMLALAGLAALLMSCAVEEQQTAPTGPYYRVVTRWGRQGNGPGQFDGPQGLAVDSRGELYVTDAGNCRIQVFNRRGKYLRSWGDCGEGFG